MRRLPLAAALLIASFALHAQTPAANWRTVETKHFRVHYPIEYEEWTMRAVSKLESIRDAVARETGYAAEKRAEVIVMNPIAQANGLTYALLDTPRIVLYTEPADPDEQIGEFGEWIDLLTTHEMTHLIHLVRPSRNPTRRILERLFLPAGPIVLGAPRWVNEGYATVIEGRLTGSGRPSSAYRAAVLRKWAESSRLPSYDDLNSDRRFMGMSMAYLAGSAFLEWLEARDPEPSLPKVWARMTARQSRSFDQAFEGVFSDSAERLYGRFTAELTERAVTVDRDAQLREGELWQQTTRSSGDPALSPDGKQIALVIRDDTKAKLVILSTAVENEEEKKLAEKIEKMLKRDPEDVAPVRTKPLARKPLHELRLPDGGNIESPRWTRDGKSLLFTHRVPDRGGDLHREIFRWTPDGDVVQITHGGDVYDADPIDDRRAVAVRSRFGKSQLVIVDLTNGAITAMTDPSLDRIVSHPRVSGERIAFAAHTKDAWHLVIRNLNDGSERIFESAGNIATPEWRGDDVVATVLANGYIDIHQFPNNTPLTRTSGAAFQPAPSSDGRLFFMGLDPDGLELRVLPRPEPAPPRTAFERSLVPALPPPRATPVDFAPQPLPPSRPYGIGRQEFGWILSGNTAPSSHATELGIRAGDVVGRLDAIAVASLGDSKSVRGATIAAMWRGLPVGIRAQAYDARERIGDQHGLELRGIWESTHPLHQITIESGALARNEHSLAFFDARVRAHRRSLRGQLQLAGENNHARAFGRGELKLGEIKIGLEGQHDAASTTDPILLGGLPSTILPSSAIANRVLDPALETATLAAKNYSGARADVSLAGLTLFYRQHRMGGERMNVEGIEVAQRMPAMPILKTPAIDLTMGAARVRHRTRWWIGVRLQP